MSKLTQKEFMDKAKAILGDRTDDEAISFLEDCKIFRALESVELIS